MHDIDSWRNLRQLKRYRDLDEQGLISTSQQQGNPMILTSLAIARHHNVGEERIKLLDLVLAQVCLLVHDLHVCAHNIHALVNSRSLLLSRLLVLLLHLHLLLLVHIRVLLLLLLHRPLLLLLIAHLWLLVAHWISLGRGVLLRSHFNIIVLINILNNRATQRNHKKT